jgi:hypothetical protein
MCVEEMFRVEPAKKQINIRIYSKCTLKEKISASINGKLHNEKL